MKIITISREFGSGGRELGKLLAEHLGIAYYDREIITAIAKNQELEEEFVANMIDRDLWKTMPLKFHNSFDKVNTAPVIRVSDSVSTLTGGDAVTVYSGIVHLGTIPAHDAEGDAMTFEILQMPSHGSVKLTNRTKGYYEYTADENFTGADSFTVRAVDRYGNRSPETRILLHAEKPSDGEVYADMDGHWANAAAITCIRAGVIDAPAEGDCFYPDEPVSRAEFLALAMRAAGYDGFSANLTGFIDEADIPMEYRGYAAAASALGIASGVPTADGLMFYPNHQITRAEAALILSRLTGISAGGTVTVFADDAVPAWASGAVSGLMEAGILRGTGGTFDGYSPLTRAAAIQLAASITARG